MSKNYI